MSSIKQLFSLKKANTAEKLSEKLEDREAIRITYYQSGYGASVKALGKPIIFRACLQNLFSSFEDQCRKQELKQERLKQPYKEEQEKQRTELKKCETGFGIYEKKRDDVETSIENLRSDIVDVRNNPNKYGIDADKKPKAQFYIGLILLLPITLYLLVFYVSASYSSFFKEFTNDMLSAAIFDKDAFTNAFNDSWLEGILVITIPFVFMGLGYVIHMVQIEKGFKSIIKIFALYLLTFLFDSLLAYQIEKKIYDFNKTITSEPYDLRIALTEAEFWMIIFAGFVVYIIWGLVFDFVMKEFENIDKIKAFIKSKKEEIFNLEGQKKEHIKKMEEFEHQKTVLKGLITELQQKIEGFIFPIKEYLHYHSQYKEGWFQAISSEIAIPHREKAELLEECEQTTVLHLKEMNLTENDFQNLVYSHN
ncbi:ABC transporter permease [Cellulophaga sp. HaHaR_3_176]|uniref:ABC transporter permease n=1 Tax=Cellulophaga sp. HaHaR_3_176 TaxID=1942464 RepID=UPI001C1FF270|nr:ABC transporter permease [Cellulophaga sp. HaHaR_3_176]QWX84965.1 ABC transporter permease [Cellulophaga sp. HaHaR_3_176]